MTDSLSQYTTDIQNSPAQAVVLLLPSMTIPGKAVAPDDPDATPLPSSGGGGGGGTATDVNQATQITAEQAIQLAAENTATRVGNTSDAAATAGSTGSLSAKLRLMTSQLAAMIAQIPATLGIKTSAASLSVAPSSDGVFQTAISSPGQAPYGLYAKVSAAGALNVSPPTVPIHFDQFDAALDTTNRWTASGTATPVNSNGTVVLDLTAANSVSSVLVSQQTFTPTLTPYTFAAKLALGSAQVNPNAHRFGGQGVVTAYAAATPLTDGFGFEVDLTGALNAVVYIAGTRYVVNSTNPALITAPGSWATDMLMTTYGQTMTWPTTGTAIVFCSYFAGIVWFYYGSSVSASFDVPIGFASYVPGNTVLPTRFAGISTPAVSTVLATTFRASGYVVGGTVGNTITDPTYPFRSATVKAASTAAVAADLPLVVALHPSTVPAVTVSSGTVTTLANGQTAHSTASTGAPVRVGGRIAPAAIDTTLIAGDATDQIMEFNGGQIIKPYSASTFDWTYSAPPAGLSNTTTPVTIKGAPAASTRNYITSLQLSSDALGAATEFALRDVAVSANSQTIASNILTISTNHGWTIGDAVIASASTVTGLTAGTQYYVLTVPSATTATFSATPGGSTLAISGTGVTATLNHYLARVKLSTSGVLTPTTIKFPTPLKGGVALATEMLTLTASSTGAVFASPSGYTAM